MAQSEAEAYLNALAGIMGVEPGATLDETRTIVNEAMGVNKLSPQAQRMADIMGDVDHGAHPPNRESTVEELVLRYRSGELKDTYELPAPGGPAFINWFDQEDLDSYQTTDGFHGGGSSYEFTKLWYQIVGEHMDLNDCGKWVVAHGGLRWEYYGGGSHGRSTIESILKEARDTYTSVHAAIVAGEFMLPEETFVAEAEAAEPKHEDLKSEDSWDYDELRRLLGDE